MGTFDRGNDVSRALTIEPNLVPTPLPVTSDTPTQLAWWGSELVGTSEVNLQATWAGEEGLDFVEGHIDVQAESPVGTGSPQVEQRRQRKKEEPGWCDQCDRWFTRRSDVRRHKNTAHAKEVHACPQCHIICSRRDALQRHIRDQH
jgi:uncharacterized C2H2 Zn-finger protein